MSEQIEARSKKGLEQQPVTLRALYYAGLLPFHAVLYLGDLDPDGLVIQ